MVNLIILNYLIVSSLFILAFIFWTRYNKLQNRTYGFIPPSVVNKSNLFTITNPLWVSYNPTKFSLFAYNKIYTIPVRNYPGGNNKIPSTIGRISTSSSNNMRPLSPNKESTKFDPKPVTDDSVKNTSTQGTVTGFNQRNQFLQDTPSLAQKAAEANVHAKVGVQTPFDYCKKEENVTEYSNNAERFKELERRGIIQYPGKDNAARLTPHGQQLFNRVTYRIDKTNDKVDIEIPEEDLEKRFIAGVITKISEETEILTPIQTHVVVCEDTSNTQPDYIVSAVLTSNKGNTGFAGVSTTIKLSDKNFNGDQQSQHVFPLATPLKVNPEDFCEHRLATDFVNRIDVSIILKDVVDKANTVDAKTYNGDGITQDILDEILLADKAMSKRLKDVDGVDDLD